MKGIASVNVNLDGTITVRYDRMDGQELQNGEKYEVTIEKIRKKRSLDANAYFHVLVGKLADANHISKPHCKNILLGRYGQREMQNGKAVYISVLSSIDMSEREDIHTIPVGYGKVGGKEFTHYAIVRGSHTYNTAEMATLIDGAVSEAKNVGIETIPPEELKRMLDKWK